MAINRVVIPELLDSLPPSDPAARRSRRDLRLIHELMGNFPWMQEELSRFPAELAGGLVEIGAGEGGLCQRMAKIFPKVPVTAIDLIPCPEGLSGVQWLAGDIFARLPEARGTALAGTMILHHFSDDRLRELGPLLAGFRLVCFCEPWRSVWPLAWGALLTPLIGGVTRHDLPVSVRAGFRKGELCRLLNLEKWQVRESVDWRGAIRFVAWKR